MATNITYVARYETETCDNELRTLETNSCILCVFDNITEAQRYAEQYYDKDCSENARIQIDKNKKEKLFIKITDKITCQETQTIEFRTLIIEGAVLNSGKTALEDIQDRMME